MARVLVTGGAGFIGSHLTQALLERGDRVRILDNFSTGFRTNVSGIQKKAEIVEGDVRDSSKVEAAVKGVDVIFHQAAFVSVPESIKSPRECFTINVQGTIELLEAARKAGVTRMVIASSAAVYGASQDTPLKESAALEILSPYAASKKMDEDLARFYSKAFGMHLTALRYFNVYGPGQSPNSAYAAAIPQFIERLKENKPPRIFGDGSQTRDFIYVGDVVRANLLAANAPQTEGQAFNICSGKETSLLDLLSTLRPLFPSAPKAETAEPRLGDVPRSLGDPSLAAKNLGFKAQVSLAEGLKQTVQSWN